MAAQHRREGKHAVKDGDLTNTRYDENDRGQLLAAVKDAGCYIKDDKKSVMARKLAEYDQKKLYEERRSAHERREKEEARQQEMENATQAQRDRRRARAKRNEERAISYECGEEVSSNSDDTDEDHDICDAGGEALSDEIWEDTCSETTIRSRNLPLRLGCRLQLFEWPYLDPPQHSPPSDLEAKSHPAPLAYTSLKLVTTTTHEKITLPGKSYLAGVDPDFVPLLSPRTRTAARHRHMLNQFSHAVIEPGALWARRTAIQGWNGRMYFSLPPQSHHDKKNTRLDDVYHKRHTANAKPLHPTPGAADVREDRRNRFERRVNNKRKRMAEVYEASLWEPLALGYMPSYLNWELGGQLSDASDTHKTLASPWYVRFQRCNVPHYYFWSLESEWSDPTISDPSWSAEVFKQHNIETAKCRSQNPQCTKFRVRKLTSLPTHSAAAAESFQTPVPRCEDDLLAHGLRAIFATYAALARSTGMQKAWATFTRQLPCLFPSGELPRAPPAQPRKDMCLADKMAALLSGGDGALYSGKEAWARDGDEAWDVVVGAADAHVLMSDGDSSTASCRSLSHVEHAEHGDDGEEALHRRDSMDILQIPSSSETRIWTWLSAVEPTNSPPSTPLPASPNSKDCHPVCPLPLPPATSLTCPFCSHNWRATPYWERAAHMLSHSHISPQRLTSISDVNVAGKGCNRRYSLFSQRTLRSYHAKFGRGRETARGDCARGLVGDLAESTREVVVAPFLVGVRKCGRETSPYSKERKRAKTMRDLQVGCEQGRGGRGWMLERTQSDFGDER
ncbi:uncharacterized protein M421DRAFT_326979 [Didymella exigua CBS 183.55]|uniref:Uncharacterized protein n=1 Tax=Didymella exigua CBS 183.55 TaxID=1150837 RepID=A0A6A5R7S0_9PLEO|nr:uncharacterized protein M421DRAFT_326979 [Didymella exigua CBS 183.55]KAF1923379.1 hypothetical protein M421DRAFT_326979 [Didymella exigua CBS 183.55]